MIAIFTAEDSEWAECQREKLRDARIPCALIGPEYGYTSLAERVPFVILSPDLPDTAESFCRKVPPHKFLTWSEDMSLLSVIREAYRERFGIDMESVHSGGIRFVGEQIRFRGARMRLTPNEHRILNLMIWCRGQYFSSEEVAALCLRNAAPGAAAVHICNLNSKAVKAANYKMIECRRFKGYRIP